VAVLVGVLVGWGVRVGRGVRVAVAVGVALAVGLGRGVDVGLAVGLGCGVAVALAVGRGVSVVTSPLSSGCALASAGTAAISRPPDADAEASSAVGEILGLWQAVNNVPAVSNHTTTAPMRTRRFCRLFQIMRVDAPFGLCALTRSEQTRALNQWAGKQASKQAVRISFLQLTIALPPSRRG
jgi:hypothetical protein